MKTEATLLDSAVEIYRDFILLPYRVERQSRRSTPNELITEVSFVVHRAGISFESGIEGTDPSSDHYRSVEGAIAVAKAWIDYNELNFVEMF